MSTTKTARVDQPAPTKPPFLTPGDITPEVLRTWEMGCRQYFKHKDIPVDEQVGKVAWGMQEPSVQEWYLNDQERMDELTFGEYMDEVRAYWLPSDWADTMRQKLLSSCQENKVFSDWAIEVQSLNALLRNTTSHLTELNLRYHLEAHMNADLRTEYRTENVADIAEFRPWTEKICLLDEKRLRNIANLEAAFRAERLKNMGEKKLTSSSRYNSKSGQTTTGKTSTFVRVPALTDEERSLLRENDGCFKCREPFAKHTTATCTNGFPDGATYKPVTAATIAAKKNRKNGRTVASVEVANTVAVVMPSAALGNGTDSDECVAPLTTPLLLWDCLIDGPKSSSCVKALIDDGSAAVLIDESLVEQLGLQRRRLHTPMPFNVALSGEQKDSFLLSNYVRIACISIDSRFTSRSVRAIVAPNLCTPLLLGGPFLHHNKIVIDHELRTCTVKDQDYELLNPQSPQPKFKKSVVPSPPKMSEYRHEVLRELKHILPEYKQLVDDSCEPVNGVDIVAAIRERITTLASVEQLKLRDAALKVEYEDRFPIDIPHNDSLPSDVLFRVRLKDANKLIQQRGYDCPRKYRDAWKTLLDQHVEAGRLRPSDSPHSSPAFIIPKANPMALPRWVNDFRQLNLNTVPDNHPLPRIDEILRDDLHQTGSVHG
ncbi:uncharacterized protein F5147DRAFT_778632 [Suillus discolor]|uniref:Uncharacterized protein n=1 Tax=Suillus discolor TaxID=1912936 RepID=A0A9P7EWY3_9AGAM|nr:uncharacterized protein F5147DRAFT_778632 [Suillus discolor]KAG2095734.1 hypothetical protein F5147DRAFT_778632 [Suillus discolor]